MPTRILREGIISSPRINALSPLAELFYRRLMTVADDYGRFYASLGTIRGACWPTCPERITEREISDWLTECLAGDSPLIVTYTVEGIRYLQILNFGQQTRGKSKFPECLSIDKQPLITCESLANPSRSRRRIRSRISEAEATSPQGGSDGSRGTRFALEQLPEEWNSWTQTNLGWEETRCASVFEVFADYWRGVAGAKGRKADWLGTWRNWCRKDDESPAKKKTKPIEIKRIETWGSSADVISGKELIRQMEGKTG